MCEELRSSYTKTTGIQDPILRQMPPITAVTGNLTDRELCVSLSKKKVSCLEYMK